MSPPICASQSLAAPTARRAGCSGCLALGSLGARQVSRASHQDFVGVCLTSGDNRFAMVNMNVPLRNEAARRFLVAFEGDDDAFGQTLDPAIEWCPIGLAVDEVV